MTIAPRDIFGATCFGSLAGVIVTGPSKNGSDDERVLKTEMPLSVRALIILGLITLFFGLSVYANRKAKRDVAAAYGENERA